MARQLSWEIWQLRYCAWTHFGNLDKDRRPDRLFRADRQADLCRGRGRRHAGGQGRRQRRGGRAGRRHRTARW
ncbi:hypothetical protein DAI43_33920, partial [Achromobacter xylosoxidans]